MYAERWYGPYYISYVTHLRACENETQPVMKPFPCNLLDVCLEWVVSQTDLMI